MVGDITQPVARSISRWELLQSACTPTDVINSSKANSQIKESYTHWYNGQAQPNLRVSI